jgi:hypothetical protein
MKKILLLAITILFYIVLGVLGWVISQSLTDIVGYPSNVLVWVAIVCSIIYAYRKNKDGMYQLFKDIHQSNLDDIEEYQLEENTESIGVKKEIQTSLKKIFKNAIGLGIAASILWVLGLVFGIFEFNDGSFKYLILSIPGVLILSYLIVKLSTILTDVFHNSDYEEKEKEEAS